MSKLMLCRACNYAVAKTAKMCPKCGIASPGNRVFAIANTVIKVALLVAGSLTLGLFVYGR